MDSASSNNNNRNLNTNNPNNIQIYNYNRNSFKTTPFNGYCSIDGHVCRIIRCKNSNKGNVGRLFWSCTLCKKFYGFAEDISAVPATVPQPTPPASVATAHTTFDNYTIPDLPPNSSSETDEEYAHLKHAHRRLKKRLAHYLSQKAHTKEKLRKKAHYKKKKDYSDSDISSSSDYSSESDSSTHKQRSRMDKHKSTKDITATTNALIVASLTAVIQQQLIQMNLMAQ